MKIDLHEESALVHRLLYKAGIPTNLREEKFQEFALHFYTYYNYNEDYKKSTYITLVFSNWLSHSALQFNTKNKVLDQLSSRIEDKRGDYLDWMQTEMELYSNVTEQETFLYCEEMMSKFKPLTQEYILEKAGGRVYSEKDGESVIHKASREEGVSRQAIEQRIRKDIDKVLKNL